MQGIIARRYVISGTVQGVGFRFFAERSAARIGVTGWARNLADGNVEIHANGTQDQLNQLEGQLRYGPPRAQVRSFEATEAAVTTTGTFLVR